MLTPVSKAQQALALASTPEEIKKVEILSALAITWAKEQDDYELCFAAYEVYIDSRIKRTAAIEPEITHGDHGVNQYSKVRGISTDTSLKDYGFNKLQWSRRKKELAARDKVDEYKDDCIIKGMLPTPHGLVGFGSKIIGDSTGDEWWTPAKYIASVRRVLGGIDLDPASCEQANKIVRAKKIYTEEDSGLDHTWKGRVFVNPPYSKNKPFAEKMREEYSAGNVTGAIILVSAHSIETQWFASYWDYVLCFTGHRIKFRTPTGEEQAGNIAGSVFIYLGDDEHKFAKEFGKHGYVVKRWP